LMPGEEKNTISKISKIKGVKKVSGVFGSWDAILEVESKTVEELAHLIVSKIRKLQGVANTETLIEVKL